MYEIGEKDKVIELTNAPQSSVGAPLPIILSGEHKILLAYLLQEKDDDWDASTIKVTDAETENELIAIIEFDSYWSFMFGAPNDEAFQGHPLYKRGLRPYRAFEIENSSWLSKFERMNSVHEHHKPERFKKFKHFVFAFHDSTFECIAENFTVSIHESSLQDIISEMQKRLAIKNQGLNFWEK